LAWLGLRSWEGTAGSLGKCEYHFRARNGDVNATMAQTYRTPATRSYRSTPATLRERECVDTQSSPPDRE
jgi:hypothetical protein